MGTINKQIHVHGYCPVDKGTASISVGYMSFPEPQDTKKNMTFLKANNECIYLYQHKCNLGRECPIYKSAENHIKLDVSDMRY